MPSNAGSAAVAATDAKIVQVASEGWQGHSSEEDSLRKKASEIELG